MVVIVVDDFRASEKLGTKVKEWLGTRHVLHERGLAQACRWFEGNAKKKKILNQLKKLRIVYYY